MQKEWCLLCKNEYPSHKNISSEKELLAFVKQYHLNMEVFRDPCDKNANQRLVGCRKVEPAVQVFQSYLCTNTVSLVTTKFDTWSNWDAGCERAQVVT